MKRYDRLRTVVCVLIKDSQQAGDDEAGGGDDMRLRRKSGGCKLVKLISSPTTPLLLS